MSPRVLMVSPTAAGRGVGTCPGGRLRADGEQAVCRRIATRPVLIVLVGGVYTMLMIVFGLGIWISANRNRALRVTGRS